MLTSMLGIGGPRTAGWIRDLRRLVGARRRAEDRADRGADCLLVCTVIVGSRSEDRFGGNRVKLALGLDRAGAAFSPPAELGICTMSIGGGSVAARHRRIARRAKPALVGDQQPL